MSSLELSKKQSLISKKSSNVLPSRVISRVERITFATILEDCVDQLAVLGGVMPDFSEKPSAAEEVMGVELAQILEAQRTAERGGMDSVGNSNKTAVYAISTVAAAAKNASTVAANMEKLEKDRQFLQMVLADTMEEMQSSGTFTEMTKSLQIYHEEKEEMIQTIKREEVCRKRMKFLKKELNRVKREKEAEISDLKEKIAYLKDELQEKKAETSLMSKQIQKESEVEVECQQTRHNLKETEVEGEISKYSTMIDDETLVHSEVIQYLQKHFEDLDTKVEEWMTRYEEETDLKAKELQAMKNAREANLQELQEIAEKYKECSSIVSEYKALMEELKKKAEEEEKKKQATIKVQAWWRGVMVRKQLGPYKPKKKEKKKKGKGKGKKKK